MSRAFSPQHRPVAFHAGLALALALCLATALWYLVSGAWRWPPWVGAWFASINLVLFGYYGYDKWQASRQGRRVPEVVLHALALAGGSVGAFAGMTLWRHKTIKGGFRRVFWVIIVAQIALAAWLAHHAWSGT